MRPVLATFALGVLAASAGAQPPAAGGPTTSFAVRGQTFAAALLTIERDLRVSLELRGQATEEVIEEFVADGLTLGELLAQLEAELDWVAHRGDATNASFIDLYTFEEFVERCHPDGTMESSPELATIAPRQGMLSPRRPEGGPSDAALGLGPGATEAQREEALRLRREEAQRHAADAISTGGLQVSLPPLPGGVRDASGEEEVPPERTRLAADHPSRELVREMREHVLATFVPLPRP